jgi:hypothetical protein
VVHTMSSTGGHRVRQREGGVPSRGHDGSRRVVVSELQIMGVQVGTGCMGFHSPDDGRGLLQTQLPDADPVGDVGIRGEARVLLS